MVGWESVRWIGACEDNDDDGGGCVVAVRLDVGYCNCEGSGRTCG